MLCKAARRGWGRITQGQSILTCTNFDATMPSYPEHLLTFGFVRTRLRMHTHDAILSSTWRMWESSQRRRRRRAQTMKLARDTCDTTDDAEGMVSRWRFRNKHAQTLRTISTSTNTGSGIQALLLMKLTPEDDIEYLGVWGATRNAGSDARIPAAHSAEMHPSAPVWQRCPDAQR